MLQKLKLQIEGVKFGYRYGKNLRMREPFMSTKEIRTRAQLAWCKHLVETNRGHFVPIQVQHTVNRYKHVL